ncbi:LacI family DNA-binding transcriptional regulator [Arthrobacter sp. 35W]|uniref:LacI family DNA-binding transcriptional regulator n=1 Tax=Arthrobacter sp. 35W TaxID=1132441 RepID=UPI000406C8FE|nr:LacI family DNA-binding transcriptional regulator [Arthrobacter sp. 35W]
MAATPRPTMTDVAAAAGVSRALVSIVIRGATGASEATRARVLAAAADLGYRRDTRARLLRSSRTAMLGVAFNVTEPYQAELVELLYEAAELAGYGITLSATGPRRSEQQAIESLLDLGAEALILLSPETPEEVLAALGLPVVSLLHPLRAGAVGSVSTDEAAGISLAMEHLRSLGHHRIAHIDGGSAVGSAARRQAYLEFMHLQGWGPSAAVVSGGPSEADGSRAARELLDGARRPGAEPHTAVVVFNDRCALGVLDVFGKTGLSVPGDISVVGYDNSRLARLGHINLTSIGQDGAQLAARAVQAAVSRIDGGPVVHEVVAPYLEPGGTTAAPQCEPPGGPAIP